MLYGTLVSCLVSLTVCWFLAPLLGVGAIAISLVAYNVVSMAVTHYWYLPKCFDVKPGYQIVKVLFPPVLAGIMMWFVGRGTIILFDQDKFHSDLQNHGIEE